MRYVFAFLIVFCRLYATEEFHIHDMPRINMERLLYYADQYMLVGSFGSSLPAYKLALTIYEESRINDPFILFKIEVGMAVSRFLGNLDKSVDVYNEDLRKIFTKTKDQAQQD